MTEAELWAIDKLKKDRLDLVDGEAEYLVSHKTLLGSYYLIAYEIDKVKLSMKKDFGFLWRFFDTILRLGSR